MHSFWQQTLCRVWLAENNTSARHASQTKGNKRNDCARKEEAFPPLLKSGRLLLKSESRRNALSQVHKGKLGWHACYFPSLLPPIIIFENGQTEKTGTPSHPFSWQHRQQLCPVHTWTADKEAASRRAAAGGLQATYTGPYKGTPFNTAVRLLLCLWQHLSMHLCCSSSREIINKKLLRSKWNRYWITSTWRLQLCVINYCRAESL